MLRNLAGRSLAHLSSQEFYGIFDSPKLRSLLASVCTSSFSTPRSELLQNFLGAKCGEIFGDQKWGVFLEKQGWLLMVKKLCSKKIQGSDL